MYINICFRKYSNKSNNNITKRKKEKEIENQRKRANERRYTEKDRKREIEKWSKRERERNKAGDALCNNASVCPKRIDIFFKINFIYKGSRLLVGQQ